MIYDLDQERMNELTSAFRAGEHRGRQQADEHVMAECVALRVRLERRESWRATLMNVSVAALVFGCWALIALVVFLVASS
jgi:hypothetical protein